MNSIMLIHPYKFGQMWVFDDVNLGGEFEKAEKCIIQKYVIQICWLRSRLWPDHN
jgi:hypothetical protein